jgi:proteasome beta subunit
MNKAPIQDFAELVDFNLRALPPDHVHGTTVIALRFDQGALIVADRRATMGNLIMYEGAEKIEILDDQTVVAISGAYARSLEVCRYLKHAFKYYERLNLFEISTEGKLMEISRALAGNMEMAMQGGVFLPIAATYDQKADDFGVYFFDTAGARFMGADYAAAGSGSERIRGVFEYIARTKGAWSTRPRTEVLVDAVTLLELAADMDSATSGVRRHLPVVAELNRQGVVRYKDEEILAAVQQIPVQGGK